jgi:hypothetical protein
MRLISVTLRDGTAASIDADDVSTIKKTGLRSCELRQKSGHVLEIGGDETYESLLKRLAAP